jgi:hypothetical protein
MSLLIKFQKNGTVLTPLRGAKPTATLVRDVLNVNNTFSLGQYQDYVLDTKELVSRAKDLTAFSGLQP